MDRKPVSKEVRDVLFRMVEENTYMRDLGLEILEMETGYVKGRLPVKANVLNPYGSVHGGCLFAMADIMTGLAVCTYGANCSTIDGHMEYVIPAMDTEYLICEATEIRQGTQVSLYEARIYDDKGQLCDVATFSFYIMKRNVVDGSRL